MPSLTCRLQHVSRKDLCLMLWKKIMEKFSIGGRIGTNLRLADDIDAVAEGEQELEARNESPDKTCARYKMEKTLQRPN